MAKRFKWLRGALVSLGVGGLVAVAGVAPAVAATYLYAYDTPSYNGGWNNSNSAANGGSIGMLEGRTI